MFVGKEAANPFVEARDDGLFADLDGLGVLLFGDRVLGRELAPIVRAAVVPRGLHFATRTASSASIRTEGLHRRSARHLCDGCLRCHCTRCTPETAEHPGLGPDL